MEPRKQGNTAIAAVGIGLALGILATPATADTSADARIRELERKLEQSIKMIEGLQSEVSSLKAQKSTDQKVVSADPVIQEQAAKIDTLEKQVAQLGTGISARQGADDGIPLHGFFDVGARHSSEDNGAFPKGRKGFNLGNFDVYLAPQFSSNVRSLIELNFEVDDAGEVGVDLERLQLGYAFGDQLTAWMGRFHTPYGYWNTAFHHGAQIQTAVSRPRFLDFEDRGGILPAHTVGAWGTGALSTAAGKLGYDAYLGNAQQIKDGTLDMKMAGAAHHQTMGGYNLWFSPRSLSDLRVGVHGLYGTIDDNAVAPNQTRLNMLGGYAVYIDDNWEILSEYYHFNNQDKSGNTGRHSSNAWYAQVGYNLGVITPYARAENADLNQADNYFLQQTNGRSYRRGVVGLRYDVDPKAALKLELGRTTKRDLRDGNSPTGAILPDDSFNEASLQYSVRF